MSVPELALPISSADTSTRTRINDPRLVTTARAVWIIFAIVVVCILIAAIAPNWNTLHTVCAGGDCASKQLSPEGETALSQLGLSIEFYATYHTGLDVVFAFACV